MVDTVDVVDSASRRISAARLSSQSGSDYVVFVFPSGKTTLMSYII